MRIISAIFAFIMRHENWCFIVGFLLFVGFVDSNSLWERHFVWESTENLKQEIQNYSARYAEDSLKLAELKTNPRRLEQVARERYLMSRPDEDIFVIVEGDNVPGQLASKGTPMVRVGQ